MTIQVSTRFKELILGANAFKDIFHGGRILLYSGDQPLNADRPVQGTLIAQVTAHGNPWAAGGVNGLEFEQEGAFVRRLSAQSWRLVAGVAGTPGWFRLVASAEDPGELSYTHPRVDGTVGTLASNDFRLTNAALGAGESISVQQWLYTIPPYGALP